MAAQESRDFELVVLESTLRRRAPLGVELALSRAIARTGRRRGRAPRRLRSIRRALGGDEARLGCLLDLRYLFGLVLAAAEADGSQALEERHLLAVEGLRRLRRRDLRLSRGRKVFDAWHARRANDGTLRRGRDERLGLRRRIGGRLLPFIVNGFDEEGRLGRHRP